MAEEKAEINVEIKAFDIPAVKARIAQLEGELEVEKAKVKNRDDALSEAKEVLQKARRKMAELEESRAQAIREMEAARKASEGAGAREDEARKAAVKSKAERLETVKELGRAVSERERYKGERDSLTTTVRQANEKIRELMEDRDKLQEAQDLNEELHKEVVALEQRVRELS